MRELSDQEIKGIQMDVLSAIDEFCRNNNIKYSLSSGTMLGAIRHKGYIPWDDDIDILLYRDDYNRLIENFPQLYKGVYKIKSLERDGSYDRPYAIAYDDTTLFIEGKEVWGVKVDIFPMDDVPDNEKQWRKYNRRRLRMQHLFLYTYNEKGSTILKTIYFKCIRFLMLFYSRRRLALRLDYISQKHNGKGYRRCFENSAGYHSKRPFDKSIFSEMALYPFEQRHYYGFSSADVYLSAVYGDYMKLPPEEERVTHHSFKAYKK